MTNIVITGGLGYIGSQILQGSRSSNGVKIKVFDSLRWDQGPLVYPVLKNRPGYSFYKESVLDWSDGLKRAIDSADVIIPLAALVGAPLCDQYPEEAVAINQKWYEKLLDLLHKQLIIYPNTNSGYGTTGDDVCTEETPCNPISLYGQTKQEAEKTLLSSYDNAIVFRLATVFGWSYRPRLDLLVNNLTLTAMEDGVIELFDGHYRRNYVHVQDVADAFFFAFRHRKKMKGQIYNLGNDEINMTKKELVSRICEMTGATYKETDSKTDPDKRDYLVSSKKLNSLGFRAERELEEGIREIMTFKSFLPEKYIYSLKNY